MGHISCKVVAKGVPKDKLFQWYTDFSSEDPNIYRRRIDKRMLSRKVRRDGNNVYVETELLFMGKTRKVFYYVVINPDNYTYDSKQIMPGMFESSRHYTFTEIPGEGTRIRFDDEYRLLNPLMRILDATGLLKRYISKNADKILRGFIAEAEEQLAEKITP